MFIPPGLVGFQLLGMVAWLVVENPATKEVYPKRLIAVLTCGTSNYTMVLSLGYNMILILMCTVYAFKTRKIPENFNEAKYIGFTMYSTCIVWLAFIPIYFSTQNDYKVRYICRYTLFDEKLLHGTLYLWLCTFRRKMITRYVFFFFFTNMKLHPTK